MEEDYDIIRFNELDSTNSRLAGCRGFLPAGTVFAADIQRKGRGQRGNSWSSRGGMNLTFSMLFKPEKLGAERQFSISIAVSLAVKDYLESKGLKPAIKWPNDIYAGDRKSAGYSLKIQ